MKINLKYLHLWTNHLSFLCLFHFELVSFLLGGVGGAIKKGVREMKIRPSQLKLHFNKLESSSVDTNSTNSPQRSTSPSVCSASSTSSSIHSSPSLRSESSVYISDVLAWLLFREVSIVILVICKVAWAYPWVFTGSAHATFWSTKTTLDVIGSMSHYVPSKRLLVATMPES